MHQTPNTHQKTVGLFINDSETFKNGCIQQPYFIYKAMKQHYKNTIIFSHDLDSIQMGNAKIKTRKIGLDSDESDVDLIMFVSSNITNTAVYEKWKQQGVKLVNLICGNWFVILQEDLVADMHKRVENSIFHDYFDEIWLMPMYTFFRSWLETMTHIPVKMFPYVWDAEIIEKHIFDNKLNCVYKPKPTENKYNLIIAEPNLSIHKTCMIPLAIAERIECEFPDTINKVFILSKPTSSTFDFMLKKLRVGKKVEAYPRVKLLDILHQCNNFKEHTVFISHQTLNSLNFMHLELAHLGFPFIHNCKPFASLAQNRGGYYYNDENVDQAFNQFVALTRSITGLAAPQSDSTVWRYNYTNPQLVKDITTLIDSISSPIDIVLPRQKIMQFYEIAETLRMSLPKQSQIRIVNTDKVTSFNEHSYIFCVEEFKIRELPESFVCLQFEQLEKRLPFTSVEYQREVIEKIGKATEIWDYSHRNVEYMVKTYPKSFTKENYKFIPYGYAKHMTRKSSIQSMPPNSVPKAVFIGNVGERRKEILSRINKDNVVTIFNNGLWDYSYPSGNAMVPTWVGNKAACMQAADILVNIKYDDVLHSSLETCRIVPSIANRCLVISEYSDDETVNNLYKDAVVFCKDITELQEKLVYYLNPKNSTHLKRRQEAAYQWLIKSNCYLV